LIVCVRRAGLERWELLSAGGAAFLGLLLRLDQYTSIPYRAPNPDEWNWSWSGLSQLLGMPPTAWTIFWKAYPSSVWVAPPPPYTEPLVHPWVDAPPVFSWIIGLAAWLGGDRTLIDVINDPRPRLIGIGLSIAALVLAYLLGRMVFGTWPSVIGAWLLAVSPIPVVLDRLVAAEQLLAVLLLAALIAVFYLRRDPQNRRWLWLLLACCAVAPAVKAPGLVIGVSAALLLVTGRHFRLAALAALATGAALALVLGYEAALNWQAFTAEVAIRGNQLSGFTGYRFITNTTGFDRQQAYDGWWLLGWLGVAEILGRRRPNFDLVAVPTVVYLLILLGTAAEYSSGYGWYRLTVMPLVYLAAGRFLWLAVVELSWVRLGVAAALAIATWQNFGPPLHLQFNASLIALLVGLAVLPAFAALAVPAIRHWARLGAFGLLVLLIPLGVIEVTELGYIYGAH
jgi:4-amino-4-deoxy-L-arabinose transferase-like glycosyltransferase